MSHYTLTDFDYHLPKELIAQQPLANRDSSRLLIVDVVNQCLQHQRFTQLLQHVCPGDVCVFNDTKVIPARLFATKSTGGKVECLVERLLDNQCVLAQLKANNTISPGLHLQFSDQTATVLEHRSPFYIIQFHGNESVIDILNRLGQIPLPPYIKRAPNQQDLHRYQTVYAKQPGAVAAPTAGLHFSDTLLAQLAAKGVILAHITLHVGAGTFQPIRTEDLSQHQMHHEWVQVSQQTCQLIESAKAAKRRVIAIGTTVARALESAASSGKITAYEGDTSLFIRPGYEFQCIDGLLTNFHLPRSSLLMLVSALAGFDLMRQAYQQAVAQQYRFFSYGDAMLIINTE